MTRLGDHRKKGLKALGCQLWGQGTENRKWKLSYSTIYVYKVIVCICVCFLSSFFCPPFYYILLFFFLCIQRKNRTNEQLPYYALDKELNEIMAGNVWKTFRKRKIAESCKDKVTSPWDGREALFSFQDDGKAVKGVCESLEKDNFSPNVWR